MKSLIAWVLFMYSYMYALHMDKAEGIVYYTGGFAITMTIVIMFKSDFTVEMIKKLIDKIPSLNRNKND